MKWQRRQRWSAVGNKILEFSIWVDLGYIHIKPLAMYKLISWAGSLLPVLEIRQTNAIQLGGGFRLVSVNISSFVSIQNADQRNAARGERQQRSRLVSYHCLLLVSWRKMKGENRREWGRTVGVGIFDLDVLRHQLFCVCRRMFQHRNWGSRKTLSSLETSSRSVCIAYHFCCRYSGSDVLFLCNANTPPFGSLPSSCDM